VTSPQRGHGHRGDFERPSRATGVPPSSRIEEERARPAAPAEVQAQEACAALPVIVGPTGMMTPRAALTEPPEVSALQAASICTAAACARGRLINPINGAASASLRTTRRCCYAISAHSVAARPVPARPNSTWSASTGSELAAPPWSNLHRTDSPAPAAVAARRASAATSLLH